MSAEDLLPQPELPLTELAREGDAERALSGGGLIRPSAVDAGVGSRDIPGICLLLAIEPVSEAVSS